MASWSYDYFFGPILGPLLEEATDLQHLVNGQWEPLA